MKPHHNTGLLAKLFEPRGKTVSLSLLVFLGAFALRLAFILDSSSLPDIRTPTPGLDTCLHWEAGKHIRAGTPDPVFELMLPSAPLHPYFVALCQSVLGENMTAHRALRAVMGSLSVTLIFLMALRITRRHWAAAVAALFVLTLHTWIYFDTMVIKAVLDLFLLTTGLALALKSGDLQSRGALVAAGAGLGVLFALLIFSQGGSIVYSLAVAAFILLRRSHPFPRRALLAGLMLAIVVGSQLGYKFRDRLFGIEKSHFLPVGGVHIRIGWQDHALGSYHILRRFPAMPLGHTFFSRMCAEAYNGHPMTPAEANRVYVNEAREFIRDNPDQILPIIGRKVALFFNNFEPSDNHFIPHIAERVMILKFPSIGYGGLVLLALWGLAWLWRNGRRDAALLFGGLVLLTLISNCVAFVTSRYRLHATVPMAVLAAPGLLYVVESARARGRRLAAMVLVTLVLGLWVFRSEARWARNIWFLRPIMPNARVLMMETAARNLRQSERVERDLKTLADLDAAPELTPQQRFLRSTLLHGMGRYTESFRELERIVNITPDVVAANRQYLIDLMWYADYDKAVDFLAELMKKDRMAFRKVEGSFSSDSDFWSGADANLRLIVQALLRDIVGPRLAQRMRDESPDAAPVVAP